MNSAGIVFIIFVGLPLITLGFGMVYMLFQLLLRAARGESRGGSTGSAVLDQLALGDRRTAGRVEAVTRQVLRSRALLADIVEGLQHDDVVLATRAAAVIERVAKQHPGWLQDYKADLLGPVADSRVEGVRTRLVLLLPKLELDAEEHERARAIALDAVGDQSGIVTNAAMHALNQLSERAAS